MDDMNKIKRTLPLPEGWTWEPHRPDYNDPQRNFERIRTVKDRGERYNPRPHDGSPTGNHQR